ncbi:MAG TPA: hypothetical protein VFU22_10840, partial [Roseiflexaceae bacterium]|nr:hypothetical protein [Roseiflexaceae bacterium]
ITRFLAHTRRGRALLGLSALDLEWNALETAERYASQALELGQAHADEALQIQSALAMARVLHARGEEPQAQAVLHALIAETERPSVRREAEACQAWLALRAGDLDAVRRWATSRPPQMRFRACSKSRRA